MAIYAEMMRAGVPVEHHESDLYVPATDVTRQIVQAYRRAGMSGITTFKGSDGRTWFDIPFAYEPFFARR